MNTIKWSDTQDPAIWVAPEPEDEEVVLWMEVHINGNLHWEGDDRDQCTFEIGAAVKFCVSGPTARSVSVGQHSFRSGNRHTWVWEIET